MDTCDENYIFGAKRAKKAIVLNGNNLYIKILSVYEAILSKTESQRLYKSLVNQNLNKEYSLSVCENASLVFMCVVDKNNRKVFKDGMNVLKALSAEELLNISENYYKLKESFISFNKLNSSTLNEFKKKLNTPINRIKWKILKEFKILPGSKTEKEMFDGDYLYCYVNMLIDDDENVTEQGINTKYNF